LTEASDHFRFPNALRDAAREKSSKKVLYGGKKKYVDRSRAPRLRYWIGSRRWSSVFKRNHSAKSLKLGRDGVVMTLSLGSSNQEDLRIYP